MTNNTDAGRAADLIRQAHAIINSPVTAGRVWAKYERNQAKLAVQALWEAHLLLMGHHPAQDSRESEQ